mmetsp:Transcript_5569/g.10762  ORF Transcript_5569/g.10762 Transcript_5569/m.10762 type:complete len:87 (-) Transcript_5569:926-1186(-)
MSISVHQASKYCTASLLKISLSYSHNVSLHSISFSESEYIRFCCTYSITPLVSISFKIVLSPVDLRTAEEDTLVNVGIRMALIEDC